MLKRTALLCAVLMTASAQPPPFFSYNGGGQQSSPFGGGPPSSSPFGGGGPPSSSPFGGGGPSSSSPFGGGGPPPSSLFGGGGPQSSSPFGGGGPQSSSPFGGGGPSFVGGGPQSPYSSGGPPSSSPFSNGPPPPGRPGIRPNGFPSSSYKGPKNPGNKLFSWLGSTMSKLQGLGPKISYHSKPKPPSIGGPSLGSSAQNGPPSYFSSGGPPPNSVYEGNSSPHGGGSGVTYAPLSAIEHSPVIYRNPSGPPSAIFGSRPGPPSPSFASSRPPPSFGARRPPLFSSDGPSPFASSPFQGSRPPFRAPSPGPFSLPQNTKNNLEVFPSQQISYQSQTLSQNDPGLGNTFGSLQSLYGSQSSNKPSYFLNQQRPFEQQSSYSQTQSQVSKTPANNYGATFHSIEPVRVAPIYDVAEQFKPSATDLSSASSSVQHSQQGASNIHDMPFATLVNEYAAQADAATAGSEQMGSSAQAASDMVTAASTNHAIPGVQILGQSTGPSGNPVFEVVADANAPTYDGHPVDLNKLISMIEPGALIDTMPSYGDADTGASEQHPMYAEAPSNLESDAAMASSIMSGNRAVASNKSQNYLNIKIKSNNENDRLHAVASESRPTVVKPDGTKLSDEKLIKEHFDKEIILDDLQENKESGFIIVGVHTDNDTGDQDEDKHLHGLNKNWTLIDGHSSGSDKTDNDDILAIVQQLRNSAENGRLKNNSESVTSPSNGYDDKTTDETEQEKQTRSTQHPNHNYFPELSPKVTLEETSNEQSETLADDLPVINPIFDTVRTSRFSDVDTNNDTSSDSSSNSSIQKTDIDPDNSQLIDDNDDNEDQMYPDDMTVSADGDLAASGSSNVKSVAIIVTPPPNYVKIRNKYKKASIPLSAMTSTSPLPLEVASFPSEPASTVDTAFSESSRSSDADPTDTPTKEQNDDDSSISTDVASAASSINSNLPNSGSANDSILNVSTIMSGIDSSTSSDSGTQNVTSLESGKKARRYPVYRGKNNNK